MRRSYISPEYNNTPIYGTFNMIEESNFFGSKMLEVEDSIYISNQNIIYYQKSTGEQVDLAIESSLPTQVYSASDNMKSHQRLTIDDAQLGYQKESNTKWILDIDLRNILSDYLFATMKRYRTFEGITNPITKTNDINTAIREYISNNVTNRYKLSRLDLYVSYTDLRSQNVLRYKNTWKYTIASDSNLLKKKQIDVAFDESTVKVLFTQEKPSSMYNFEYYFNILFEKI
jgi:hypothetical protein